MFGFFAALRRLTASINTSADLFDGANEHLKRQLAIDGQTEAPALGHTPTTSEGIAAPAKGRNRRKQPA